MVHADNLRVHLILKEEELGPTSYMLQALTEEGFVLDVQAAPPSIRDHVVLVLNMA